MSDYSQAFVDYLQALKDTDRGALATLRHSLAFEPGTYPKAFPYVERFAKPDWHERDARRVALYAVAGLFASHPVRSTNSFATGLGELMRRRDSPSIEKRFVALLGADAEDVNNHMRQAVRLLAAEGIGCDYARLYDDLSRWLNLFADAEERDRLRQRWARDFYHAAQAEIDPEPSTAK